MVWERFKLPAVSGAVLGHPGIYRGRLKIPMQFANFLTNFEDIINGARGPYTTHLVLVCQVEVIQTGRQ